MPLVSVLMSVYNGAPYLREAIDSILHQTFTDFEFIIIDDGSNDGSPGILASYADPRIRLMRNDANIGLTRSLNKGLQLAQGDYVARMDADDISLPERLEKQVACLARGYCKVCFTRAHIHDARTASTSVWQESPWPVAVWRSLFEDAYGLHPSVMFDRESVMQNGSYDEAFHKAQDYELFDRFCARGEIFCYVPEILFTYRRHDQRVSATAADVQEGFARRISFRAMRRYLPDISDNDASALRWLFLRRETRPPLISTIELLPLAASLVAAFLQSSPDTTSRKAVWRSAVQSIAHRYLALPSSTMKRDAWKLVLNAAYESRDWRLLRRWLRLVTREFAHRTRAHA